MEYKVDSSLSHQVLHAASLVLKFTKEPAFWQLLAETFYDTGIKDDLITHETDIRRHLEFMFTQANATVFIVPYKTKNPFSSVIGHAEGNTIFENVRKMDSLTLAQRVGHIGHETTHLFGYSHDVQGDRKSATVRFGEVLEVYAERRLKEMNSIR